MSVIGEGMYGKVDRVPGICHVITIFLHGNYLPFFPLRSFVVLEGSDGEGEFRGKQVPISLKSVLAGYIRAWGGFFGILLAMIGFAELASIVSQLKINQIFDKLGWVGLVLAILPVCFRGGLGVVLLAALHILSVIFLVAFSNAEWLVPVARRFGSMENGFAALIAGNLLILAYVLTRLFNYAGPARKRELLELLGIELPPEDESPREETREDSNASEHRPSRGG